MIGIPAQLVLILIGTTVYVKTELESTSLSMPEILSSVPEMAYVIPSGKPVTFAFCAPSVSSKMISTILSPSRKDWFIAPDDVASYDKLGNGFTVMVPTPEVVSSSQLLPVVVMV